LKVTTYIQQSLFEHDCVIVPGFGGFLKEHKASKINLINNQFCAPSTSLAFNASLTKDDGLLKSEISINENITLDQASNVIRVFVEENQAILANKGELKLENLGSFLIVNSKLQFTPDTKSNYNSEGFGLDNFVISPIHQITNDTEKDQKVKPIQKSISSQEETISKKSGSKFKWFFIGAPTLLLLAGTSYFGIKFLPTNKKAEVASTVKIKEPEQAGILNTLTSESSEVETKAIEEISTIHTQPTKSISPKAVANKQKDYHIIGGVFSTEEFANNYKASHNNSTVLALDGMYKVALASYTSLDEAKEALSSYKAEYGKDLWILKNTNK
jgi:nucleoid DNA-binding protein